MIMMKKVFPYENPETEVMDNSPNGIDPVPEDDDPFNFD